MGRSRIRPGDSSTRERCSRLDKQPSHRWQVGDRAMLAGEPVTIAGFIDHEEPGPLDELLVELANGDERTVRRDELTTIFDVIQGHWHTHEVYLAGGRLNPGESLAVAQHSPDGFGWGDGGSGPAQLALAILLRATDQQTALAHYQAFKWDVVAKLPQADFSLRLATVREWLASRAGC